MGWFFILKNLNKCFGCEYLGVSLSSFYGEGCWNDGVRIGENEFFVILFMVFNFKLLFKGGFFFKRN